MSDKPSAAWYLAPILMGIVGSAIMWYVLKDEDHSDSPKMIKKGWVIGIVLTVIPFIAIVPMMLLVPWHSMDFDQKMEQHMERKMMGMISQGMMNDPQVQQGMMQLMNQWMLDDPGAMQEMIMSTMPESDQIQLMEDMMEDLMQRMQNDPELEQAMMEHMERMKSSRDAMMGQEMMNP